MSLGLVAYNASDDSDDDVDESLGVGVELAKVKDDPGTKSVTKPIPTESKLSGYISDEDEYDAHSSKEKASRENSIVSSLEGLPNPSLQPKSTITEDDVLEDIVKPKPVEIQNAQKPPKKRQPVKIMIPSLEDTKEDEEEGTKEKPTASKTKSGLFSLLPPPIHSAKKEINRPLIPHTLTKKAPAKTTSVGSAQSNKQPPAVAKSSPSSSQLASQTKPSLNIAMYGSDSDEDDDITSNFFSLDSKKEIPEQTIPVSQKQAFNIVASQPVPLSSRKSNVKDKTDSEETIEPVKPLGPEPGSTNDAPLDFGQTNMRGRIWSAPSFSQCHLEAVGSGMPGSYAASSSAMYNMVDSEVTEDHTTQEVADDHLKQFMSGKEFDRLSGKRKRGLEEAITFVDAKVDDYVDPSELSKYMTEESEYVSHKNKDNMPTAQQRRKKQITYLAFQAKERELELKNQWAENRMTKRQTQSKYGF